MKQILNEPGLSVSCKGILGALIYFDIFNYPLTAEEIRQCSRRDANGSLESDLEELVRQKLVFRFDDLYSLRYEPQNIERRRTGNKRAENSMEKARSMSKLIAAFPFVRSVSLSGSISKNYMDEETDIDYFIITAPNRLWIARMFLILFKKIFLFNSRKYFCVNYFITADCMEVEEKNLFTAIEIKTLIPTFGEEQFRQFHNANAWTNNYFPNFGARSIAQPQIENGWMHKKALEKLLDNGFGDWMDDLFMRFTIRVWKSKFKGFDNQSFEIALKSKPYVSKHHPNQFQKKVLQAYSDKLKAFERQHNISLAGYE